MGHKLTRNNAVDKTTLIKYSLPINDRSNLVNIASASGDAKLPQSNINIDFKLKAVHNNEGVIGSLGNSDSHSKGSSKNQPLKILHQNIRGLKYKINEFLCHLPNDPPHVLCFTEHHLRKQELSHIHIENYILGSNYCRKLMHKGGVSIFILKKLTFIHLNLDDYCSEQDIEVCAIKLKLPNKYICILTIYRAPIGKYRVFLTQLDQILQKLSKLKIDIIICGDFNINYLTDNSSRNQLDALLMSYNLVKTVTFPTRFDQNSCSAIDNIFIDTSKFEDYFIYPLSNGLSDHDAQIITLQVTYNMLNSHSPGYSRKFTKSTIAEFQYQLSFESWNSVFETEDVNDMFNTFLNSFLRIFYSSFPLIKINKKLGADNSWMTKAIRISCKRKRTLYTLTRNCNDSSLMKYYKDYCKVLSKVILQAKKMHYENQIKNAQNKNKKTWELINKEITRKTNYGNIQAVKIGNNNIHDKQHIAEAFNTYYLSIVEDLIKNKIQPHVDKNNVHNNYTNKDSSAYYFSQSTHKTYARIKYTPVTTMEIENIIKSLKTKCSYGYDEISSKILKLSSPFIISPLNYIFNKVLSKGVFPDRLKYSIIKPLYKKGSRQELSNYRPISLLTSFSKIIEKIMQSRLLNHLNKLNILAKEQFGFRPKLTTDNAIFALTNEILNALNNKLIVGGIFCDIEKAFDSVNFEILLAKLQYYGIQGIDNDLYRSYLHNRYQRVSIYDTDTNSFFASNWARIKHGVPQGSILGPLLFLIYINDFPQEISNSSKPILFADDTSILLRHSDFGTYNVNIQTVFESLNNWFKRNLLFLNLEKSHYIRFVSKNNSLTHLQISDISGSISNVTHTKFLGLLIDSSLNWKTHIDHLVNKLSTACYAIRQIKPYMSQTTLLTIYYALFHSIMSYGIIFWGNCTYSSKVFKIQKRAVRIIMGRGSRDSCRNLFKELNILPLQSQYILSLLLFVIHNLETFITNQEFHNLNTRHKSDFHLPQASLACYQKGVYFSGIKLYNSLPSNIKCASGNIDKFKKLLKTYLKTNSFYSVDEFLNR